MQEILRKVSENENDASPEYEPEPIASFVSDYFGLKYKNATQKTQAYLNFIFTVDTNIKTMPASKLFSKFASNEFDGQMLQFFLFVRHLFEGEFKLKIFESATGALKNPAQYSLSKPEAQSILSDAFGSDDTGFLNDILKKYLAKHKVDLT